MFNTNGYGYSLADVAAATGRNNGMFGNDGGAWWIIILFLFCFMGGNWNNDNRAATANEVQNDFNFASLERQNQGIIDNIHQASYDVTGAVKDGNAFNQSMMKDIAYDINGEIKDESNYLGSTIRDVRDAVQQNGYEIGKGFCSVNSNIDSIRYDNAMNVKELLASNNAQTQKILDVLTGNRMADMQNQINQLQLHSALCGVVRYPTSTTYTAGYAPFYGPYGPGTGPFYGAQYNG